jgi:ribosomal protein S19
LILGPETKTQRGFEQKAAKITKVSNTDQGKTKRLKDQRKTERLSCILPQMLLGSIK